MGALLDDLFRRYAGALALLATIVFCSFLAGLAVGVSVGVSYGSTNGRVGDFSSCVLWGVQDLCGLEKPLVRADPGTCGAVGTACPA